MVLKIPNALPLSFLRESKVENVGTGACISKGLGAVASLTMGSLVTSGEKLPALRSTIFFSTAGAAAAPDGPTTNGLSRLPGAGIDSVAFAAGKCGNDSSTATSAASGAGSGSLSTCKAEYGTSGVLACAAAATGATGVCAEGKDDGALKAGTAGTPGSELAETEAPAGVEATPAAGFA